MRMKTWSIMFLVSLTIILAAQNYGGRIGLLWGFGIALSINMLLYFGNETRLLHHLRCRPIEGQDPWGVVDLTVQLAAKARVPLPKLFIFDSDTPTAFALGRNLEYGCIVISQGLLQKLDKEEVGAVLAHELMRIKQQATFGFGVSYIIASVFIRIGRFLDKIPLFHRRVHPVHPFLVFPVLALLIVLWPPCLLDYYLERHKKTQLRLGSWLFFPFAWLVIRLITSPRHYLRNDAKAGALIENPRILAEVLWKIGTYSKTNPIDVPEGSAHIFIVNPLTNRGIHRYFNFHPSIERRINGLAGSFPV